MKPSLSLVVLATLGTPLRAQSPPIFASSSYGAGQGPAALAARDLDGDGLRDLVVANSFSNDVTVLLASAGGGFAPGVAYAAGSKPIGVVAADMSGDGVPDLAVGNNVSNNVSHFLGLGDGSFATVPFTHALATPNFVDLVGGDFNLDGKLDLVGLAGGNANAFLGTGAGFDGPILSLVLSSLDFDVGDFDEDGRPDLVVVRPGVLQDTIVSLYTSLGDGTFFFAANSYVIATFGSGPVTVGDLDGDSHLDAAVVGSSKIAPLLGTGLPSLAPGAAAPASGGSVSVAIADADADGVGDVVASFGGSVGFLKGDGFGSLAAPALTPLGASLSDLVAADLDGDGRVDFAGADSGGGAVVVLRNQTPFPAGLAPYGVGTHGCEGAHGVHGSAPPRVNTPGFKLLFTNAPADTLGVCLIGDVSSPGVDPFGFGVTFLIDPAASALALQLTIHTDVHGFGAAPAPIPNLPSLASATVYAQGFFFTPGPCSPSPIGFSSSSGLGVTIAP